jgi:hypothetical protein
MANSLGSPSLRIVATLSLAMALAPLLPRQVAAVAMSSDSGLISVVIGFNGSAREPTSAMAPGATPRVTGELGYTWPPGQGIQMTASDLLVAFFAASGPTAATMSATFGPTVTSVATRDNPIYVRGRNAPDSLLQAFGGVTSPEDFAWMLTLVGPGGALPGTGAPSVAFDPRPFINGVSAFDVTASTGAVHFVIEQLSVRAMPVPVPVPVPEPRWAAAVPILALAIGLLRRLVARSSRSTFNEAKPLRPYNTGR